MSQVVSVAPAFPGHRYPQQDITDAFAAVVLPAGTDRGVLDRLHRATGVTHRHLALPLDDYVQLPGFGAANDAFIEVGTRLGAEAIGKALAAVGLTRGRRRPAGHHLGHRDRRPEPGRPAGRRAGAAAGRQPGPGLRPRLRRRRRRGRAGARPTCSATPTRSRCCSRSSSAR